MVSNVIEPTAIDLLVHYNQQSIDSTSNLQPPTITLHSPMDPTAPSQRLVLNEIQQK